MSTAAENPYKDLYIYYIDGRIDPGHKALGPEFIGNWEEDSFSFLFFNKPSAEKIGKILSAQPGLKLIDDYRMTYEEWQGDTPFPIRIGRFEITTPWELTDSAGGIRILLDPGVVFGTGTHPTTRDCIEAIELAFSNGKIGSAVDLGTGTGVLAIAAAHLGAGTVLAADINHLAVLTAKKNFSLNGMQDRILPVRGLAQDLIESQADLLIANIHHEVMKKIVGSEGFLSKKWFVLSGLLKSEAREILFQLSELPVKIINKWECNGIWHTFLGKTL